MKRSRSIPYIRCAIVLCTFLLLSQPIPAQKMDGIERDRMKSMLANIKSAIKKDYYDPNYHGIDIEARFKQAEERLKEVTTTGQSLAVIAQVLVDFDDSHLYFLPPATNLRVEYGWRQVMYGDKSFVTLVKPKSDAEAMGLKVGDQVLSIEGFRPARKEMWKVFYYYNLFGKRATMKMKVLSPGDEHPRDIEFKSKITAVPKVIDTKTIYSLFDTTGKTEVDYNYFVKSGNVAVWKMPTFSIDPESISLFVSKVKNSPNLILDLRGNGGGYVDTLEKLAGYLFDRDLIIAQLKGRKDMDPQKSKTRGLAAYTGNLIVLVDSNSGSAAEILARLVQLEKRGKVFGDVSAGAVMESKSTILTTGANGEVVYGASITHADVIMSDGNSLENVGVIPDELVVPTGEDLANLRDPILAKAFQAFGVNMSADAAGKFFRYKWTEGFGGVNRIEIETP